MKAGSVLLKLFCIVVVSVIITSCVGKRAMVHSDSSFETVFNASKKAIDDIGFTLISADRETGLVRGAYDRNKACCQVGAPWGAQVTIKVSPAAEDSLQSRVEVQITPEYTDILRELLQAIKNEVPDVKIDVAEK